MFCIFDGICMVALMVWWGYTDGGLVAVLVWLGG